MFARIVPPWAWAAATAVVLAVTFAAGFRVASWKCESDKLEAVQRAIKRAEEARDKVHKESTNYEQAREQGRIEAAGREQAVRTIYRDRIVDAACEPPADALRVLDDALGAAAARAAGEPGG